MTLTHGSRFVDRLAERLGFGRRDDDRSRIAGDGVFEDRNLPVHVGFSLRTEFRNVDAEVLAGLAGAGHHDLPVERCRVLDDDRNGDVLGKGRRRSAGKHGRGCQGHQAAAGD